MKEIIHYGLVLMIIAGTAGLGLFGVNQMTRSKIEKVNQNKLIEGQKIAFPGATDFSQAKTFKVDGKDATYYEVLDHDKNILGYELLYSVQGYQSQVKVLTGITTNYVVKAISVLDQAETPGLGAEVDAVPSSETLWQVLANLFSKKKTAESSNMAPVPAFQAQYAGKELAQLKVVKTKTSSEIEAISGATITSVAVTKAVRDPLQAFMQLNK